MTDTVIRVENLSKQYRIGARVDRHATLRDQLAGTLIAPFRRRHDQSSHATIWALKEVSFEIKRGEAVGIIGRNGAGKSTLLKILSRITEPTEGRIRLRGRVGSLLEVGTGFHPELTGRENIYLNGAILGMHRTEIARKFDEIVDFAEIDKFIDTPVKRYSSGMYIRLAFAVAAHLEPDILLVDEVLAVGDVQFQKKCLGKMGEVAKGGQTILFVSHNMNAIQALCERTVWLEGGQPRAIGPARRIVSEFLEIASHPCLERIWPDPQSAPGNEDVRLHAARLLLNNLSQPSPLTISTPFAFEISFWNMRGGSQIAVTLGLFTEGDVCAFYASSASDPAISKSLAYRGLCSVVCHIPAGLLNSGTYRVELLVVRDSTIVLHREDGILVFEVLDEVETRGGWYGDWPGAVRPLLHWTVNSPQTIVPKEQI
jgi:lipopolysaccharide transport system ATP-binding protein